MSGARNTTTRTTLRLVLVTMLVAGVFAAVAGGPADPEGRSGAAAGDVWTGPLVPQSGVLYGAWIKRNYSTQTTIKAAITARETSLGRKLGIDHHFYTFGTTFPSWREPWDISNGRIPLIAWNGTNTSQIVNGSKDSLIRTRARAVKALGAPVFLRFFWEPENKLNLIGSATEYINAWRRVRSIFDEEGATNVTWAWCGTAWGMRPGGNEYRFYPGDAYVDWVCTDGYNWAPGEPGAEWQGWSWIMQGTHDFAVAHNKPVMIAEFGVQERNAGEKAAWMRDAQAVIKTSFPNIKAIVYFDENRLYDWRVDTTTSSFNAYKAWMQDPFYNATPGDTPPDPNLVSDDFEDGDISDWTSANAAATTDDASAGLWSLRLATFAGQSWARHGFSSPAMTANVKLRIKVGDFAPNAQVSLVAVRDTAGSTLVRVLRAADGRLGLQNARTGSTVFVDRVLPTTGWHSLRALVTIEGADSSVKVFYDGYEQIGLRLNPVNLGTVATGSIELGETGGASPPKAYSIYYDVVLVEAR